MPAHERIAVVLSSDATGLGAVRSLHDAGVPTIAVTLGRWEPVRASRFAEKRLVPKSADLAGALLETLDQIRAPAPPVLIPTSDFLAHFISQHHTTLKERFLCCVPPTQVLQTVMDKARDTTRLADAGFPLPRSVYPLPDTPEGLLQAMALPIIIKPRTYQHKNSLGWRNVVLHAEEHVREFYATQSHTFGSVIAQELIPGPDDALWECMGVFDAHSELRTAFTFRKFRTMPAHYGQTSHGRSERNDAILSLVRAIGKHLGYVGPADFDLKYDYRDGTFKYLELNPRVGMCNYFAARCGANVTYDAYCFYAGVPVGAPANQREGQTFLAVLEDVGARLYAGDRVLQIMVETARALRARPVGAYFSWSDVGPGPWSVARLTYRLIQRAWRGQLGAVFSRDYGRVPNAEAPSQPQALGAATRDASPRLARAVATAPPITPTRQVSGVGARDSGDL